MEEDQVLIQENTSQSSSHVPEVNNFSIQPVMRVFPEFPVVPTSGTNASGSQSYGQFASSNLIDLVPLTFQARPAPLSLNLSLASSNLNEPSSSMHSAFKTIGVA